MTLFRNRRRSTSAALVCAVAVAVVSSGLTAPDAARAAASTPRAAKPKCDEKLTQQEYQDYIDTHLPAETDSVGIGDVIYREAIAKHASERVQLAAFEAALVESGMRNLAWGDCDSVGVFQQRPNAGWCDNGTDCVDVTKAADAFLDRAIGADGTSAYSGYTAGQIAQKVQGSAYPTRYDASEPQAKRELERARQAHLVVPSTGGVSGSPLGGYWTVKPNGQVLAHGGAPWFGDASGLTLNAPVAGMAATPSGAGYWLVASDGGIFSYGDAKFYGSMGGKQLNAPVVGMAATSSGLGYWLVASDGGIFSYGDAQFYGSMGGKQLNAPVVGMAATSSGLGYWLVASDGGIFSYGDAQFYGSTGGQQLNKPVVGMARTVAGQGYWLVASDGGIFNYGDAGFYGSTGSEQLANPIEGMAATASGAGYWLVESDGVTAHAFGDAAVQPASAQMPFRAAPARAGRRISASRSGDGKGRRSNAFTVYDAKGKRLNPRRLRAGDRVEVVLAVRNAGTDTWMSGGGPHPLLLVLQGSKKMAKRSHLYVRHEWLSKRVPAMVAGSITPPGATTAFMFPVVLPKQAQHVEAKFNLEALGLADFGTRPFRLDLRVRPRHR